MKNSDRKIFNEIKKGNLKTFERLFKKYYSSLCNYATKYLKDLNKAEEVVQELFYRLWEKRNKLDINVSLKSYLYRAVYNGCLQYLNHRAIEIRYEDYYKKQPKEYDKDASEAINMQELNQVIDKTLNSLPERCRNIFLLNRQDGLKYREIAEKMDLSVKTVEANMGKALKLLRKNLKNYVHV
jgi:RNA polymerase sigma-70 factor (ECF subfamily)